METPCTKTAFWAVSAEARRIIRRACQDASGVGHILIEIGIRHTDTASGLLNQYGHDLDNSDLEDIRRWSEVRRVDLVDGHADLDLYVREGWGEQYLLTNVAVLVRDGRLFECREGSPTGERVLWRAPEAQG